jgi:hypothetical protein
VGSLADAGSSTDSTEVRHESADTRICPARAAIRLARARVTARFGVSPVRVRRVSRVARWGARCGPNRLRRTDLHAPRTEKEGEQNDPTAFLLERTIQLQTALDSRVVIEQAKGILAHRDSISTEEAFDKMRREARSKRMKLRDLAAAIVASVSKSTDTVPG